MILQDFRNSTAEVLKHRKYIAILIISAAAFLFLYVYIPIFLTPGNDLQFFLQITLWWQFLILILLALAMGLLISMQFYIFSLKKKAAIKEGSSTVLGGLFSFTSGIFSSATCASCVSAIFSFLGTGGVLFLLKYRWQVVGISFMLVVMSLLLTSKRLQNHCKSCEIPRSKIYKHKQ